MITPISFRRILPLLLLLSPRIIHVGAQPPAPDINDGSQYPYGAKFSPTMAIIIVVLVAALFLMGFISIYIRHSSGEGGSFRRALSMRGRRGAAARGLDESVLQTFPTFTYSEVKDHKIGTGALECAVCLNEFEADETLRLIPKCDHVFHPECIDAWLESHVTCPVCRANLVPQPGDDPVQAAAYDNNNIFERSQSRIAEIMIQVDDNQQQVDPVRSSSLEHPNRPPRSWSVRTASALGLAKFRSHSTGHSLIQPGQNLDRFTLKLPDIMRKEMMERAVLNRTGSYAVALPRERSSRRGFRAGDGSSRGGRFYDKMEKSDHIAISDRWNFFSRGSSMRSANAIGEAGESSGAGGPPVKLPSFRCLEPKTLDEVGLIAEDRNKPPV